uniref:Butyrophilin subfamily 3 member A3-like n=1 Tax=Labrus bergylta TaxID=56723 RepID=A0A3Q3FFF4_9LABR
LSARLEYTFLKLCSFLAQFEVYTEVCILKESCILPCSFKQGDKVLVHWIQLKGNTLVQSYYSNRDQLERQDQRFKGRTSLFQDQISKGNASLRLTGVKLEDQGRYKCYTSTTNALVDCKKITLCLSKLFVVSHTITCSSEGIYPQPELTWSSSPPTNLTVADTPTVHQKEKLYSINSSLTALNVSNLDYSCTISTGRNKRRATLSKPGNFKPTCSVIGACLFLAAIIFLLWFFFRNGQGYRTVMYVLLYYWTRSFSSFYLRFTFGRFCLYLTGQWIG